VTGRHILIYEPGANGHQMELIRYLLHSIQARIQHVSVTLLTTENSSRHPNCVRLLAEFPLLVTLRIAPLVTRRNRPLAALSSFYEWQWRNAESFACAFDEIGPESVDFVFIPYLENVGLLQLGLRRGLFRGRPWGTLAISVRYHQRRLGIAQPWQFSDIFQGLFHRRVLRDPMLAFFGTLNPFLKQAVPGPKMLYCPEPIPRQEPVSTANARAAYGLRAETCVVLAFGIIDQRKCIDILLEGAARLVPEIDLTVFLAGPQNSSHVGAALNGDAARKLREHGRLVEANRFLLSGQDIDPLAATDITWVYYERKFVAQSSVLTRSAVWHRPVIVRRRGVIARQVEQFNCGITIDSEAPDAIAEALRRLATDPELRARMGENGARGFVDRTPENFARPMVDAISRVLVGQTAA
jgi:glycosyltransferase involved in cell wall biosynthesis